VRQVPKNFLAEYFCGSWPLIWVNIHHFFCSFGNGSGNFHMLMVMGYESFKINSSDGLQHWVVDNLLVVPTVLHDFPLQCFVIVGAHERPVGNNFSKNESTDPNIKFGGKEWDSEDDLGGEVPPGPKSLSDKFIHIFHAAVPKIEKLGT
jgi:hypothetical protein